MNKKKGFSLVEVVVALGILAFVFAGTVGLVVQIVSLELSARNKTEAVALAQKKMAETVTKIGDGCNTNKPADIPDTLEPNSVYNYSVNIDDTFSGYTHDSTDVGFSGANFYKVTVVVTWNNRDSVDNTYTLKQLVKK